MKTSSPRILCRGHRTLLGESPVWDERTESLYWVDIERGEILHCNIGASQPQAHAAGQKVGSIALRPKTGNLLVALKHSIALLALTSNEWTSFAAVEPQRPGNRCNDGKCDASGNFWVGTCDQEGTGSAGWLYRISADGDVSRMAGPFGCANGPAFSPDGRRMYCVDSARRIVYFHDVTQTGQLSEAVPFVEFRHPDLGYPDGLTCDIEGCVWIAHWAGSRVSRFDPRGQHLETLPLPVTQPTSCTFGGRDFRTLFITSAAIGLESDSDRHVFAGSVLALDVDVPGFAAARFAR